jgi:hypothetical protein
MSELSFSLSEYADYAGDDVTRWSRLVGGTLGQRAFGEGQVVDVVLFQGQRRVILMFESDGGTRRRTLSVQALLDLRRVTDIRPVGDSAELIELREQLDQRAKKMTRLQELAVKFKMPARSVRPSTKLLKALEYMDAGQALPDECALWLRGNPDKALVGLLADYRYREYCASRDPWVLAQASALYRDAALARHSLRVTDGFKPDESSAAASAAVLTSRAAALADLERLDESYRCAKQALVLQPNGEHVCNLLGRLECVRGHGELGDAYFARAEAAGSDPDRADAQRRQALEAARGEARERLARFLIEKDPARYWWARKYLRPESPGSLQSL